MLDRFTEKARRVIFFARYEASKLGSGWIETDHILLALMREDGMLPASLPQGAREEIRQQIDLRYSVRQSIPTSVDLPLSGDSKRVLEYGCEESDALRHKFIDTGHLVLGLLRIENCAAAALLREHGIHYARFRVTVSQSPEAPDPPFEPPPSELPHQDIEPAAPSLRTMVNRLHEMVDVGAKHLEAHLKDGGQRHIKRKPWSRKEALGHLIDWAAAHQQWFARALTEPIIVAGEYPADELVPAQQYWLLAWQDAVDSWASINRVLIHVLSHVPENKLNTPCRIGIREPIALSALIANYVDHCEDILGQIMTRG